MANLASSSSSMASTRMTHDVYMSFQNEDAGKFITDMIEVSLGIRGVPIFKDEKQLRQKQKGTNLGRELKASIGMSKISIVLFSKDYCGSSWCLEELHAIMETRRRWGLIVLPIFYEMDPSDVRKQRGDAGKVVNIQRKEGVWYRRWKSAMKEAADLIGWDHRGNSRIDSYLIGKVAEDIVSKRIPTNLIISIYPLRYDTCDQYLNLFLQMGMEGVLIVGICGPTGMGKTGIAKSVYDQMASSFQGSCFLANVSQNSRNPNGLAKLQEKLISDILLEENVKVMDHTSGMEMIVERLKSKRVLIVLDDVDNLDELHALVGGRNWFGMGSKIIITTRRVHLLYAVGVDQVFMAQGLPLPPNVQAIWEPFLQSRRVITEFKNTIQELHQQTMQRHTYLKTCLLKERQKNASQAQVIAELEQAQVELNVGRLEPQPDPALKMRSAESNEKSATPTPALEVVSSKTKKTKRLHKCCSCLCCSCL